MKTKVTLFAGLLLTLTVSLISLSMADAQVENNDQARIDIKKQKIADNFQHFLKIREEANVLERALHDTENSIHELGLIDDPKVDSLIKQRDALKIQIDAAYQEMNRLEQISNELHKIPPKKERLLEETMQKIIQVYQIHTDDNPDGLLEDVFISTKNESIYVLKSTENYVVQNPILQSAITNMESELSTLAVDNNIKIVVSRIIEQSSCNLDSERDDYCQPSAGGVKIQGANTVNTTVETTTLSFPATRNSVSGFVMVAHGTLTQDGGEDIYQPTKSGSNKIGDLVVGMDDASCDCSFIDLSPGRTVDAEVVSNDTFNWDIDEYIGASGQTVGNFVYMSGITSGVEIGQIDSKPGGTNRIYADYDSAFGDSGGPVGKVLSGEFDVYGIHEGRVEGDETLAKYVPYDAIASALDLD